MPMPLFLKPEDSGEKLTFSPTDCFVAYIATLGAIWTVFVHAMTMTGQNFSTLSTYAPAAGVAILLAFAAIYKTLDRGTLWRGLLRLRPAFKAPTVLISLSILLAYAAILFISYWDLDEVFYANISVYALSHPELPLFGSDGMHGYSGLPVLYPVYKLHTFELLAAYLARLTGSDPVLLLHIFFPLFYNALALIAWYKLLEYFFPQYKYIGLLCFVILALGMSESNESPGANQFLRLYQGKTVAGLIIVPLLTYYSIRFLSAPSRGAWYLLMALNVFALGLSSSALFWNTLLLGTLSAIMWGPTLRQTAVSALNGLSAWYLVLAGLAIKSMLYIPKMGVEEYDTLNLMRVWPTAFGEMQGIVILIGCAAAWFIDTGSPVRNRVLRLLPLCVVAMTCLPPLAPFLAAHLTMNSTLYRVAFLLPAYLYMFVLLLFILHRCKGALQAVLMLAWFVVLLIPNIFNPTFRGELSWPGRKSDHAFYAMAHEAHDLLPPGTSLLAPDYIAMYLPWMTPAVKLVAVRIFYFELMHKPFGVEESDARRRMIEIVGERVPYDGKEFRRWLGPLDVGLVIVHTEFNHEAQNPEMVKDLEAAGFIAVKTYDKDYNTFTTFVRK